MSAGTDGAVSIEERDGVRAGKDSPNCLRLSLGNEPPARHRLISRRAGCGQTFRCSLTDRPPSRLSVSSRGVPFAQSLGEAALAWLPKPAPLRRFARYGTQRHADTLPVRGGLCFVICLKLLWVVSRSGAPDVPGGNSLRLVCRPSCGCHARLRMDAVDRRDSELSLLRTVK